MAVTECFCAAGSYLAKGDPEKPVCLPCPKGMECAFGSHLEMLEDALAGEGDHHPSSSSSAAFDSDRDFVGPLVIPGLYAKTEELIPCTPTCNTSDQPIGN